MNKQTATGVSAKTGKHVPGPSVGEGIPDWIDWVLWQPWGWEHFAHESVSSREKRLISEALGFAIRALGNNPSPITQSVVDAINARRKPETK